jgi:hypothetical protein
MTMVGHIVIGDDELYAAFAHYSPAIHTKPCIIFSAQTASAIL